MPCCKTGSKLAHELASYASVLQKQCFTSILGGGTVSSTAVQPKQHHVGSHTLDSTHWTGAPLQQHLCGMHRALVEQPTTKAAHGSVVVSFVVVCD